MNSQGVLFVGDTRVAAGTGTPGEEGRGGGGWGGGVLGMNRSPARGLEQDIKWK